MSEANLQAPSWVQQSALEAAELFSGALPDIAWERSTHAALGRFTLEGAAWILKVVASEDSSEVRYYRDHPFPEFPLPRFRAGRDRGSWYWIVMEDLGASHEPSWERPKTIAYARALGEAVARLHARAPRAEPHSMEKYRAAVTPGLAKLGSEAERGLWAALEETIEHDADTFIEIHGDLNPGNILVRRDGDTDLRLIDRQPLDYSIRIWSPVSDLAYAITHWWSPEERLAGEAEAIAAFAALWGEPLERIWAAYRRAQWLSVGVVAEWRSEPEQEARMEWVWRPQWERTRTALGLS